MIKSLVLKNFQKHKKLKLLFSPGITSIVGRTDSGKSSVMRALRWVSLNVNPRDFIRNGSKEAVVVLKVLDSPDTPTLIVRRKGRSNVYKLNGKPFKAFGSKVPDRIGGVLNVSDINFQRQHDPSFWLSSSGPEVSRQLNKVIDLSVIDSSLSKSAKLVRQSRERVNVSEERLRDRRREYKELRESGTARVESFKVLAEAYEKLRKALGTYRELDGIVESVDLHNLPAREKREKDARELLEAATRFKKANDQWHSLDLLTDELTAAHSRSTPPPPFKPVGRAWNLLKQVQHHREELQDLVGQIFAAKLELNAKENMVKVLGKKLPDRCPTCGKAS